jgi:hypothetical protein
VKGGAAIVWGFRPNGDITLYAVPPTQNVVGDGTSPPDQALVSPGQVVQFQLKLNDIDQYRQNGGAWQDTGIPKDWPGTYDIYLTLTNATFTGTTDTTKSFTAIGSAGGYFAILTKITVADPWAGDVTVKVEVEDKILIPANLQLEPGLQASACQDPKFTKTLTWKRATVFPTEITPDHQVPGALESEQTTDTLTVWYLYGPGPHPKYEGVGVTEIFAQPTSNLKKEWLKQAVLMAHPTWTDDDWTKFFFTITAPVTFTIGATDFSNDTHSGKPFAPTPGDYLSTDGLKQTIYADFHQTYVCPPGTDLVKYDIRFSRVGTPNGQATYTIKKWKP